MKILLTGHEGFIGSFLKDHFQDKADITCFEGDITDWDNWISYVDKQYDMLIHLAAIAGVRQSFEDPELYFKNNVIGTDNAFKYANMCCKKVLYASSSNAYDWTGNPYATTKKMNEVQALSLQIPAKGMRFHTVWPGRDDMLYKKLQNNKVTYINAYHTRDWIHVEDLCNAIWTIISNWTIINETILDIGNGEAVSVLDMAQKIFDWDGEIRYENPKGERIHTKADIQYLRRLGWKPQWSIMNETGNTK